MDKANLVLVQQLRLVIQLPVPPVIRPRADRVRAATVRADSSTTDSTLTFEVEAEGLSLLIHLRGFIGGDIDDLSF